MAKQKPERRQQRAERDQRAAAALEAQRLRERRRARLNYAAVALAVVLVVVVAFALTRSAGTTEVDAPPAGSDDLGVTIGPADAPREVVVYEDFLCPFCGELERATGDELAELAAAGDVRVEYRPFQLLDNDYSLASAAAFKVVLDASGPEVAKAFHDLLFAEQPEEDGGPYPDADWLVDRAVEAGATEADVRDGIEDGAGEDWVAEVSDAAQDAGVRGTPTVLLDGEVLDDASTVDELAADLLDAVRGDA